MGPEVRFKSARRCQGYQRHQGYHCIDAGKGKQQSSRVSEVFRTFSQFLGFSGWELFMRYRSSQAFCTHTDLITVISIHLFTSTFVTVIKFVDFKSLLLIVINQFITVVITILILHYSSVHFGLGESHGCQTNVQRLVAKVIESSGKTDSSSVPFDNVGVTSVFSLPSLPLQRSANPSIIKRGIRDLRRLYHRRPSHIRRWLVPKCSILDDSAPHRSNFTDARPNSARLSTPQFHILLFSIILLITSPASPARFLAPAAHW